MGQQVLGSPWHSCQPKNCTLLQRFYFGLSLQVQTFWNNPVLKMLYLPWVPKSDTQIGRDELGSHWFTCETQKCTWLQRSNCCLSQQVGPVEMRPFFQGGFSNPIFNKFYQNRAAGGEVPFPQLAPKIVLVCKDSVLASLDRSGPLETRSFFLRCSDCKNNLTKIGRMGWSHLCPLC